MQHRNTLELSKGDSLRCYSTGFKTISLEEPVEKKNFGWDVDFIYKVLKFHLALSLLKSNSANVGVLSPEDTNANFFPELGTTLGMIL
jgi:hypothetical protein